MFHFVPAPLKPRQAPRQKKAEDDKQERRRQDVYFDKLTQKIVISERKLIIGKKRKRDQWDTDENRKIATEVEAGKSKIFKALNEQSRRKRLAREGVHIVRETGSSYQAKGGKGDLILKNKPLPYSFI